MLRSRRAGNFLPVVNVPTDVHHRALFHVGADAALERIVPMVQHDLAHDAAVLVCLPDHLAAAVVSHVEGGNARLHRLPVGERYARPVGAMHALWEFTTDALRGGAPYVHSVGQLDLGHGPADDEWHWYEAAIQSVFTRTPLVATCLYDTTALPDAVLAAAASTHATVDSGAGDVPSPTGRNAHPRFRPPAVPVPDRPADLTLHSDIPAAMRAALRAAARDLPDEVVTRALIVLSELATNAVKHGGGHAEVALWLEPAAVVVEVLDEGDGIVDPFATLRPPRLPARGAGLWISHLESTQLSVEPRDGRGTRAVALVAA